MIKWCAYCQQFLEEIAPFDQLTVSHGICQVCYKIGIASDNIDHAKLEILVTLQKDLYAAGQKGDSSKIDVLIDRCSSAGVRPLDMIFGFLNPMLVQIGFQWEKGQITAREEHIFTKFAENMLEAIRKKQPALREKPTIILVSADTNYHTFGLKLIHIWLSAEGISSELITPGLPLDELLQYTTTEKPAFVGFSISDKTQLQTINEYIELVNAAPELKNQIPQILIGGYPVKSGKVTSSDISSAILVNDFKSLFNLLTIDKPI